MLTWKLPENSDWGYLSEWLQKHGRVNCIWFFSQLMLVRLTNCTPYGTLVISYHLISKIVMPRAPMAPCYLILPLLSITFTSMSCNKVSFNNQRCKLFLTQSIEKFMICSHPIFHQYDIYLAFHQEWYITMLDYWQLMCQSSLPSDQRFKLV